MNPGSAGASGCRLAIGLLLIATISAPVRAATLTVTSSGDDGTGSLRQAVLLADSGDTIDFNLTYPVVIVTIHQYLIDKNLTIVGPGSDKLVIDGSTVGEPTLWINSGITLTISGVDIHGTNFSAITNVGALTLSNSILDSNFSTSFGGAISNSGTLTVNDTTFNGNVAGNQGGALANGGTAAVNRCTFIGDTGQMGGGAIYNTGTLEINNSSFIQNYALGGGSSNGGAIDNIISGSLTVNNSTFNGNLADNKGGAISNGGSGIVTLDSSTLSGNVSSVAGASGIQNYGASTGITVRRTIIADSCFGSGVTSAGDNLGSNSTCFTNSVPLNDRQDLDPQLGPLANYGGPTKTMALLLTSPARDAVIANAAGCSGTDQRGTPRPIGPACDIGAFELDPNLIFKDGFE